MKRLLAISAACVLALGLSACSPTGDANPPVDYQPGELSGADPKFASNMAECLANSGWDVEVDPDNSYGLTIPPGQEDAYDSAEKDCKTALGYDHEASPLTDAEKKHLFAALTSLADCLEQHGHEVRDRPSEQAFLDDAVFDPYGEIRNPASVGSISEEEYFELLEACPRP